MDSVGTAHPATRAWTAGRSMRLDHGRAAVRPWPAGARARGNANGATTPRQACIGGRVVEIILTIEETNIRCPESGIGVNPRRLGREGVSQVGPMGQVVGAQHR